MTISIRVVLLVAAVICFTISAFDLLVIPKVNAVSLGLACFAASFLPPTKVVA